MASCLQTLQDEGLVKPTCVVCCHPCQIVCYGPCNHLVCHRCMTKLRILCQDQHCPVCRSSMDKVIFTDVFQSFDKVDINSMHQCSSLQGLYFSTSENLYQCQQLLIHQCRLCVAKPTFKSFNLLRDHLKDAHKRYFCNLCVEHLKLFTNERRLYSKPDLHNHIKNGDKDDKSYKGHPLCKFCKKHYFDDDDLYLHLHRDHFSCSFCPANHYYNNYESLRQHFKESHYLCEIDECINEKFVNAFSTDIDYKAHLAQKHKHLLNRAEERRIRHVDIDLTYSRTNPPRAASKNHFNNSKDRPQRESIDVERNEMEDRLDTLAITGDYEEEFPSLADNATKTPSALTGYSTTDKSYTVKERHKNGNFKQSVPQRNFQQQKVFQKVAGIGKSLASDEDFPSLTPTSVPTGGSGRSRQSASQSNWKSISHDHKLTSKKNQNPSSKAKKNPQKVGKSMDDFPSLPTKKAAKIPDFVDDYSEQNSTKPSWGKSSTSNSANQFSNDSSKYNQKGSTNTIKAAETFSNSKNKPKGKTKKKSNFSLQNNDNDNYKREESSSEVEKNWKGNATSNSTFNPSMPIGNRFQEDFPVLSSNGKPSDPFIPDQSHNEFAEMESVVTNPGLQDDYFGSSNSQTINEVNTVAATLYSEAMSNNFSDGDFPALPMKEKPTYDWLDNKKRDEASNSQWKIPSSNTSNFNTSVASTEQQLSTKVSVRPPPGISTISSHQDSGLNVRLTGDNMLMNDLLMESNNQDNSNNVKKSIKLPPGLRKNKVAAAAMSSNAEAMQRNDRYTPPTDAQKRQTKLITLISKNLKSTEKLNDFKKLSTDYRHKRLSAANFYSDCLNLFGDYFYQILPEMVALVPDIERQNDLFKIWCDSIDQIKSQRKIWRAVKNESSTDLETICTCLPCPSCGQIVIENDFDQHITYHSNFVIG